MFNRLKRIILNCIYKEASINAINLSAAITNKEAFSDIKNINYGKAIALCGGGPSLENYKPINNCIHVALNRALLNKNISFDWFIADDWEGIDFFRDELIRFDGLKFFGHQQVSPDRQIPESFRIKCNARRYYTDIYRVEDGFKSKLVCDIDKMAIGNMPNIALSAMQIVLFTNPSIIYLVGCDASQGHFVQPKELDKERIAEQEKNLKKLVSGSVVLDMWRDIKAFAEEYYPETRIISINPVGLKGIFEDVYQEGYKENKN